MAVISKLKEVVGKNTPHTEAEATYSIFSEKDGRILQIDTYGSKDRQFLGKKTQSIRFSREALTQLKLIIQENNL